MDVGKGRVDMVLLAKAYECKIGWARKSKGRVVFNEAEYCREGQFNLWNTIIWN